MIAIATTHRQRWLGLVLAALACLAGAAPAAALSFENSPLLPADPVPPPGVTSWDVLGKAAVIYGEENGEETVTTIIPPEVERLDGAAVTLMGYMFPLDAEPEMRRFLLVEYPADCAFCLAGSGEPSRMAEVEVKEAIHWEEAAIVVAGRLEVLRDDADGLVYRLHDARVAP
jgi:hypothetical protein